MYVCMYVSDQKIKSKNKIGIVQKKCAGVEAL